MEEKEIVLGFGPVPGRKYVFIGTGDMEDKSVWYSLDFHSNEKQIIEHPSLTGYLTDLKITPKLFKDKVNYKLDIYISADDEYVIRSGADTTFASGIIHGLLMVEDIGEPLTFIAKKGNSDKIVFGNLMDPKTKTQFYFEGERYDKLSPVIFQLQEKFGFNVQSKESILEDINKLQNSPKKETKVPEKSGPVDDDLEAF